MINCITSELHTKCWFTIEETKSADSELKLSSAITSTGNWAPVLHWSTPDGEFLPSTHRKVIRKDFKSYTLLVTESVLYLEKSSQIVNYFCTTSFEESDRLVGNSSAGNVPDYQHTCHIQVQHKSYLQNQSRCQF